MNERRLNTQAPHRIHWRGRGSRGGGGGEGEEGEERGGGGRRGGGGGWKRRRRRRRGMEDSDRDDKYEQAFGNANFTYLLCSNLGG